MTEDKTLHYWRNMRSAMARLAIGVATNADASQYITH